MLMTTKKDTPIFVTKLPKEIIRRNRNLKKSKK